MNTKPVVRFKQFVDWMAQAGVVQARILGVEHHPSLGTSDEYLVTTSAVVAIEYQPTPEGRRPVAIETLNTRYELLPAATKRI